MKIILMAGSGCPPRWTSAFVCSSFVTSRRPFPLAPLRSPSRLLHVSFAGSQEAPIGWRGGGCDSNNCGALRHVKALRAAEMQVSPHLPARPALRSAPLLCTAWGCSPALPPPSGRSNWDQISPSNEKHSPRSHSRLVSI